jgi:hypothetical protein
VVDAQVSGSDNAVSDISDLMNGPSEHVESDAPTISKSEKGRSVKKNFQALRKFLRASVTLTE